METDDTTAPRCGYVEHLRESTARERTEQREQWAEHGPQTGLGRDRGGGGERNKDRECRQRSSKEPTAEIAGCKGMRSWGKGSL